MILASKITPKIQRKATYSCQADYAGSGGKEDEFFLGREEARNFLPGPFEKPIGTLKYSLQYEEDAYKP